MSSFLTPLLIAPSNKIGFWKILEPFSYYIEEETFRIIIKVPVGFETDFASIPRLFWNILPPFGSYGKASIVHDFLYSTDSNSLNFSRRDCDRVFLQAMGVLNTGFLVRHCMWAAVRAFGWMFYKLKKEETRETDAKKISVEIVSNV